MTSSLVVGPLQAYRYWHARWHEGKPVLQSLYSPTIWPPDAPLQAMCENSPGALAVPGVRLPLSDYLLEAPFRLAASEVSRNRDHVAGKHRRPPVALVPEVFASPSH